jgi:hypothetical protein
MQMLQTASNIRFNPDEAVGLGGGRTFTDVERRTAYLTAINAILNHYYEGEVAGKIKPTWRQKRFLDKADEQRTSRRYLSKDHILELYRDHLKVLLRRLVRRYGLDKDGQLTLPTGAFTVVR